jgi:hypothetical protein
MDAEDLKKRTKEFALRILKLVAALPNNLQGRTIGGQLMRPANKGWDFGRFELSSCLSGTIQS